MNAKLLKFILTFALTVGPTALTMSCNQEVLSQTGGTCTNSYECPGGQVCSGGVCISTAPQLPSDPITANPPKGDCTTKGCPLVNGRPFSVCNPATGNCEEMAQ